LGTSTSRREERKGGGASPEYEKSKGKTGLTVFIKNKETRRCSRWGGNEGRAGWGKERGAIPYFAEKGRAGWACPDSKNWVLELSQERRGKGGHGREFKVTPGKKKKRSSVKKKKEASPGGWEKN